MQSVRVAVLSSVLALSVPISGLAQTFSDVPTDHWAYSFIETIASNNITAGCGGGIYCPNQPVTRAQIAVFLERGMHGGSFSPPGPTGNVFLDVGANDFAASFIEQFFLDGITAGCGNNNYCPHATVTRDQMAVFLLRAKYGSGFSPPSATGIFNDVPVGHWAAGWIEQLAAEGITAGCGGGNYCPDNAITRAQMAVFVVRTFSLVWPPVYTLSTVSSAGGTLYPTNREVELGNSTFLTLVSDFGYAIEQASGCNGSLRGNIYIIPTVDTDCEVSASFVAEGPDTLPDSLGAQRTLVALVNFPDNNDTSLMSVAKAAELIRDGEKSLNRFIVENSDGKAWVVPDFVDWLTLDRDSSFYFSEETFQQGLFVNDAVSTIVDAVPSAAEYDRMIIMAKDGYLGYPGCFAYVSKVQLGSTSRFQGYAMFLGGYDMSCNRAGRIEHEFGHTLGFGHTKSQFCDDVPSVSLVDVSFANNCSSTNVTSVAHDTMGGDTFQPMYSPAWREAADWLDPDEILEVDQPGVYTLVQSSMAADGVKLLKIPFGTYVDSTRLYHYVELRTSAGLFDPPSFVYGNLDYRLFVRSSDVGTVYGVNQSTQVFTTFDLIDYHEYPGGNIVLDVGTDFIDPYRDVSISVVGIRGSGESLEVDLAIEPPRSVILPSSLLRFSNENIVELEFSVRNLSSSVQTVTSVAIGGRDASSFAITSNSCDSITLQPMQDCAISVARVSELSGLATVHIEFNNGIAQQLVEIIADSILNVPPYDPNAALQWQDIGSLTTSVDWRTAVQFCGSLEEDGANDWRLPLIEELRATFQFTEPPLYEIDVSRSLWSITEVSPTHAYYIYGNNAVAWANTQKTSTNNALCVRSL